MKLVILSIAVLVMTISGTFGAMFFKKATAKLAGGTIFPLLSSGWLYLGGICYALGALMNIVLLRYMEYSVLYPMTCLTYVWTMVISNLFFREKITKNKVIALMCIVAGVVLVIL